MTDQKPAMQKVLTATAMHNVAEYDRPYYHVTADDDVTLSDLLRPAFWAHHVPKLKPGALVDVVNKGMTLDVQLRVVATGPGFVNMRPLRVWEDKEVAKARAEAAKAKDASDTDLASVPLPPEYKIGASKGAFSLTFLPTETRLETNLKTRAAAIEAAKKHAKAAGIAWPETVKEPATT
jgi:hypothetical protein